MHLAKQHPASVTFHPDSEVLPGIRYGRLDQLLSPAYWHWRCSTDENRSSEFITRSGTLREEIGFCLLGGFGITKEVNDAFFKRLKRGVVPVWQL